MQSFKLMACAIVLMFTGCAKGELALRGLTKKDNPKKVDSGGKPVTGPFQTRITAEYDAEEKTMSYHGDVCGQRECTVRPDVVLNIDGNVMSEVPDSTIFNLQLPMTAAPTIPLKTSYVATGTDAPDVRVAGEILSIKLKGDPTWTAEGDLLIGWEGDTLDPSDTISVTISTLSGASVFDYDFQALIKSGSARVTEQFASKLDAASYTISFSRTRRSVSAETWENEPDSPLGMLFAGYRSAREILRIPARP